jgi:hypothetical protein
MVYQANLVLKPKEAQIWKIKVSQEQQILCRPYLPRPNSNQRNFGV